MTRQLALRLLFTKNTKYIRTFIFLNYKGICCNIQQNLIYNL